MGILTGLFGVEKNGLLFAQPNVHCPSLAYSPISFQQAGTQGNRKSILSRTLDKKIYSPDRASYLGTLTQSAHICGGMKNFLQGGPDKAVQFVRVAQVPTPSSHPCQSHPQPYLPKNHTEKPPYVSHAISSDYKQEPLLDLTKGICPEATWACACSHCTPSTAPSGSGWAIMKA